MLEELIELILFFTMNKKLDLPLDDCALILIQPSTKGNISLHYLLSYLVENFHSPAQLSMILSALAPRANAGTSQAATHLGTAPA